MNTDRIVYRPQPNTYIIRVGGKTVEVDAWTLRREWNVPEIESILMKGTDASKKDLLDSIVRIGGKVVGCPWDDDDSDKYNRDVYLRSVQDPIDALYRGSPDPADTIVACAEMPKFTPDYDPNATPKIYFNNRFPSMRSGDIIDEAIDLLNAKKDLRMTKTSIEQVFEGFK